jgi:hypothetical protein
MNNNGVITVQDHVHFGLMIINYVYLINESHIFDNDRHIYSIKSDNDMPTYHITSTYKPTKQQASYAG